MSGMDAVALLGNLGLKEKVIELESSIGASRAEFR
jgi:hypothetical protein